MDNSKNIDDINKLISQAQQKLTQSILNEEYHGASYHKAVLDGLDMALSVLHINTTKFDYSSTNS